MSRNVKWTHELRCLVYRTLVRQFGAHKTWGAIKCPNGKKSQYDATLRTIAQFLSQLTGTVFAPTAVKQQVDWATSNQSSVINSGFCRQYILNKAAALESGFLDSSELPASLVQTNNE